MKVPLHWLREYVDFPSEKELGENLTSIGYMQDGPIEDIAGDRVLDLEVRQNRSDGLSMIGVAREVSAVFKTELQQQHSEELPAASISEDLKISITDSKLCFRFNALRIKNVKIVPSPEWLQQRLAAYGIKSINSVVDITNFVMIELGQPLHAFDAQKLAQPELTVRSANEGEEITVLSGKKVSLTPDDIVIVSNDKLVAVAGIIGGVAESVSDATTDIILEAATYNQASIRRTTLRHTLRTEASTRLEKFLHPELTELALARALQLIKEISGGELLAHTDVYPHPQESITLHVRRARLNRIAGFEIPLTIAEEILERLEIKVTEKDEDSLTVTVPYFRTDIEQEDDVIEEILRLHGYTLIPEHLPHAAVPKSLQSEAYTVEEDIRNILVAAGYDEQITEPLTDEQDSVLQPVRLQNSLTAEKTMLRTSLLNSLLKVVHNRQRYRQTDITVFEVGKIYFKEGENYKEERVIGLATAGVTSSYTFIKGAVELVFTRLGFEYSENTVKIDQPEEGVYIAQINLSQVLTSPRQKAVRVLTSPPQVLFQDFSFTVAKEVKVGEVLQTVKKVTPLITQVLLGEDPRDKDEHTKSIFLKVTFSSTEKTLSSEDVEPLRQQVIEALKSQFNAYFA